MYGDCLHALTLNISFLRKTHCKLHLKHVADAMSLFSITAFSYDSKFIHSVLHFPNAEQKVPPNFDLPLKPVTVNEGETLSLSCHVRGSPPLKIQWMKDRRELTSSATTKVTFVDGTATLEMAHVSKSDAGDYLCKATNDAGSEFCKSRVTVKGISPPCPVQHCFLLNTYVFQGFCFYLDTFSSHALAQCSLLRAWLCFCSLKMMIISLIY